MNGTPEVGRELRAVISIHPCFFPQQFLFSWMGYYWSLSAPHLEIPGGAHALRGRKYFNFGRMRSF